MPFPKSIEGVSKLEHHRKMGPFSTLALNSALNCSCLMWNRTQAWVHALSGLKLNTGFVLLISKQLIGFSFLIALVWSRLSSASAWSALRVCARPPQRLWNTHLSVWHLERTPCSVLKGVLRVCVCAHLVDLADVLPSNSEGAKIWLLCLLVCSLWHALSC